MQNLKDKTHKKRSYRSRTKLSANKTKEKISKISYIPLTIYTIYLNNDIHFA